ncbi:hypothetical protein GCM10022214_76480 [Actinomadura miaoliensis]|uniref:Transposase n=1 Tax=Actinomadura miaoliensis TaxID=430685 RepID=A0ABP7WZ42_9ACTN
MLTGGPEGPVGHIEGDLRDPERLVEEAAAHLGLDRPVGVLLPNTLDRYPDVLRVTWLLPRPAPIPGPSPSTPAPPATGPSPPGPAHRPTPYYSGKHRRHGMSVQVDADAAGRLVRASAAVPGSAHDLTAAPRTHGIIAALTILVLHHVENPTYQE